MFNRAVSLPSVMQHSFSEVPNVSLPRSSFDRSFGYKTTFDHGLLIPFLVDEVLPGDTFNVSVTALARMSTPLRPFMDNIKLDTHFFFVPNRLLQTNWVKMQGEQVNPADTIAYSAPTMTSPAVTGYLAGSVMDYMGLPTEIPGLVHNTYPLRAYNRIWNDWFRDENLQNSVVSGTNDGPDTVTDYSTVLPRGKRHDYFTSCLPFPQKGTAVSIGLSGSAEVWGTGTLANITGTNEPTTSPIFANRLDRTTDGYLWASMVGPLQPIGAAPTADGNLRSNASLGGTFGGTTGAGNNLTANYEAVFLNKTDSLTLRATATAPWAADLSGVSGISINDLRLAIATQQLLEQSARGGTRYTEILKSFFGVTSSDARLQRAEYLGGGSTDVITNEIPQTSETSGTNYLGQLAAKATALLQGHGFVRSFEEHGILIGLISTRADLGYQQGLNKMWSRSTRYDWYVPAFANLGEQAVLNKEIYAVGTSGGGLVQDAATFGYQERWAEYRYKPSVVTGQFRSNFATPLDSWHLAIDFSALPALNSTFIVETQVPVDRVTAAPTYPNFLLDAYVRMNCARVMPVYSVPGLERL